MWAAAMERSNNPSISAVTGSSKGVDGKVWHRPPLSITMTFISEIIPMKREIFMLPTLHLRDSLLLVRIRKKTEDFFMQTFYEQLTTPANQCLMEQNNAIDRPDASNLLSGLKAIV